MHSKHLGTDAYYLGSTLVYLVDWKLPDDPATNLLNVWEAVQAAYRELKSPSRFGVLTLQMFRAGGSPFPCLKGKASEIKHLAPALEKVAVTMLDNTQAQEALILKGLQTSRAIDECLHDLANCPRSLPAMQR